MVLNPLIVSCLEKEASTEFHRLRTGCSVYINEEHWPRRGSQYEAPALQIKCPTASLQGCGVKTHLLGKGDAVASLSLPDKIFEMKL